MEVRLHQTMERADWLDQLASLCLACPNTSPEQQADRLQEFNDLLILAPEVTLIDGLRPVAPSTFDGLLRAAAHETAVLSMLDDAVYMISCGCGSHMATIVLPSSGEERTAMGDTLPLALLTAISQALLEAAQGHGPVTFFAEPEDRFRQLH